MKPLHLLTASLLSAALPALADTPIETGDADVYINVIGYPAVGMRYATSDELALFAAINQITYYSGQTDTYDTGSGSYIDGKESGHGYGVSLGSQWFIKDGFYASAKAGYMNYRNDEDNRAPTDDESYSVVQLYASAIVGFEEHLSERLAVHSEFELQVGHKSIEDTDTGSDGELTSGRKTSRLYYDTAFVLGLSYTLDSF